MSNQTTANTPAEPRLCKMGCGFFGNGATGDCCSKCWREQQKKLGNNVMEAKAPEPVPAQEQAPQPMEIDATPSPETEAPVQATPTKKKNKKTSYKNMMATMMQGNETKDVEKEKEALKKVTGGGAFSKVEKI